MNVSSAGAIGNIAILVHEDNQTYARALSTRLKRQYKSFNSLLNRDNPPLSISTNSSSAPNRRPLANEQIEAAAVVLIIWSTQTTKRVGKWLPQSAFVAYDQGKVLSISIDVEPEHLPPPFNAEQAFDLRKENDEENFALLFEIIMTRLGYVEQATIAAASNANRQAADRARNRRQYSYLDLDDVARSERLDIAIRSFSPDLYFSFDARGGLWAQLIADRQGRNKPIVIGFRLKRTGPRKPSIFFDHCAALETDRWSLMLPPTLLASPKTSRILLVDDYSYTGGTCTRFTDYMVDHVGFARENIRTLTLITTDEAERRGQLPDYYGEKADADVVDLFYMYRR